MTLMVRDKEILEECMESLGYINQSCVTWGLTAANK